VLNEGFILAVACAKSKGCWGLKKGCPQISLFFFVGLGAIVLAALIVLKRRLAAHCFAHDIPSFMAAAVSGSVMLCLSLFVLVAFASAASPWEDKFVQIPNRARAYEHLAYYTSLPHVAGTFASCVIVLVVVVFRELWGEFWM